MLFVRKGTNYHHQFLSCKFRRGRLDLAALPSPYVWVHNRSNMPMFCLKKLISHPWVVQKSQFLEEMTLTQYILMSLIKKSKKIIKDESSTVGNLLIMF